MCQLFFMGQTLLIAFSTSIPLSSFLRETRFCSRRQRAKRKCSPFQKSLRAFTWLDSGQRGERGSCLESTGKASIFLMQTALPFSFSCFILAWGCCELGGGATVLWPQGKTQEKRRSSRYCRLPAPDLLHEKNNPFTCLKRSQLRFVTSNWTQS